MLVISNLLVTVTLREKCPYSELFWSAFSRIRAALSIQSEYGKMWTRITPNKDTFYALLVSVIFIEIL